jgi:hypothetical protein
MANDDPPAGDPAPQPDDAKVARIVGIVYLTFCSGVGGGFLLYWHPRSIYCRASLALALAGGLLTAILSGIRDPAAKPIRWGLLWLAIGLALGPGLVLGSAYLLFTLMDM